MGYSSQFTSIAKLFFKYPLEQLDVYVHEPKDHTSNLWIIVADAIIKNFKPIKGSGMSNSKTIAFIKALVELAEVYIIKKYNFNDRDGIAGGLFQKTAILRAQAELVERDAFLYHYRRLIPFKELARIQATSDSNRNIYVYEMESVATQFHCFIATDSLCASGLSECLLIGLGCHIDRETAIQKAIGEYSTMVLDHKRRPNWCAKLSKDISKINRLPDLHHVSSRDIRNINIFKKLCTTEETSKKINRSKINLDFKTTLLESPLYFFSFVKIECTSLTKLQFGIPELSSNENRSPFYHPIW